MNEEFGVQYVTDPGFECNLSAPGPVSPCILYPVYFLKFQKIALCAVFFEIFIIKSVLKHDDGDRARDARQ